MSFVLAVLIQSSILLAVALIAMRLTKPAVAKVAIGRATLVGVLALAALGPLLAGKVRPVVVIPAIPSMPAKRASIFLPPKPVPLAATVAPQTLPSIVPKNVADRKILKPSGGVLQNEPKGSPFRPTATGIWAAGAAISLIAMLWGHVGLVFLRRRAVIASSGPAKAILQELAPSHRPDLRESNEVNSPLLCGLRHPAILLPKGLEDEQTLRPVLAHEMAHFNRRDVPWSYLGRAIQSVLWFQPLLWVLRNQLTAASEEICDAEAVSNGCTPAAYANCLVKLAEARNTGHALSLTAGMASSRSRLSSRVEAILSGSLKMATGLSKRARVGIGLAAVVLVVSGGTLVAPAFAQTPGAMRPDVAAVWESTKKTYENLKSISFEDVRISSNRESVSRVLFVPNRKVSITNYGRRAPVTYISDGQNRYVFDASDAAHYLKTPLGEASIFDPRPNLQLSFPACWPLQNMFGPNLAMRQSFYVNAETALSAGPEIDGVKTVCLSTPPNGKNFPGGFKIYIGEQDHLIHGTSQTYTGQDQAWVVENQYRSLKINVEIPDAAFRLNPPKGAVEMHEPAVFHSAPEASALLKQMNDSAMALRSASAEFEVTANDGLTKATWHRNLAFQAPGSGKSELVAGAFHINAVSDGESVLVQNAQDPKRYNLWTQKMPNKGMSRRWDISDKLLGTGGYPHPSAYAGPTVEQMYCGVPSFSGYESLGLSLGKPTVFEGEPVDVIEARSAETNEIGADNGNVTVTRLLISKNDHLLRLYEVRIIGPTKNMLFRRTVVRNVKVNQPMDESLFTVRVPSGAKPIGRRDPSARLWYEPNVRTEVGSAIPALTGTLLDGKPFNLASLRGKVVVVYAWTNGVIDVPGNEASLIKLQKELGPKGAQVIGLAVGMDRSSAIRSVKARKYSWPNLLDGPSMKSWNIHLFPLDLVIDKHGVVQGKNLEPQAREAMVRALLAQK